MQINRTTIIQGPAQIIFGGQTFWSKGNIVVKPVFKRFSIETAHAGKVDERHVDRRFEITFEPSGRMTPDIVPILLGTGSVTGTSLFGSTDSALVVHGRDGIKITFHNTALTSMPTVRMGVNQTHFGPVTFTALIANSTAPTNAAAYYTIASASYPGDSAFDVADIPTRAVTAIWGASAPWDAFITESGWEVAFNLSTSDTVVDGIGTVDMVLQGLDVSAKAFPVGPTMAQVLAAMDTTADLGTSLAGDQLQIGDGTVGLEIKLPSAALVECDGIRFGASDKRIGQCTWISLGATKYETSQPA